MRFKTSHTRFPAVIKKTVEGQVFRMKKLFFPISAKLILIIGLLVMISLSGMTILATIFFSQETKRSVKLNTLERAELSASKIETELNILEDRGKMMASILDGNLAPTGKTATSVDTLFYQEDSSLLGEILVRRIGNKFRIDNKSFEQGRLEKIGAIISIDQIMESLNDNISLAFAGGKSLRNVSPSFGVPAFALCVPFTQFDTDKSESIIVIFARMDRLSEALKTSEMYSGLITTTGGELLIHPDANLVLARTNMRSSPIVKDSMENALDNKQIQFVEKGVTYLGSYKKFYSGELTVFSLVSEKKAMEGVYRIQLQNFLITVVFLSITVLLIIFFSRSLTGPIRLLVQGTNQIGEGNYQVKIPVKTNDELGQLTEAFMGMSKGLAEREKIKTAFGKFVNKEIAERVMRDEIQLGGENKNATIFFSDIRSFTAISEKLTPHQVVEFLNDYMTRMVACVNQTHGVVDKFIGDAVMAVWGAPYSVGNDTENAVNGALMMRKALREFNKGRGSDDKPFIKIGCGINTGPVVAGQIGSNERMEYTVIGDAVNLASRIESLNKPFRTDILISEQAYELVKDIFVVEPMKKIHVKGKSEPQQIFAVIGRFDDPDRPSDLDSVRRLVGYATGPLEDVDPDKQEEKYEILE